MARAAVAEPHAARGAGGVGVGERQDLEPLPAPVTLGGPKAADPVVDVPEARRADRERDEQQTRRRQEAPAGDAAARQRGERHRQRDGRRREVGLDHQRHHRQQRAGGREAPPARVAGRGDEQRHGADQQGRGSARERPEVDPAPRPRGADAEARDEHRQRDGQRGEKDEWRRRAEAARPHPRHERAERCPAREPDQMAHREVGGRADARGARARGGRRHDRQPERPQPDGGNEEQAERERAAAHRIRIGT